MSKKRQEETAPETESVGTVELGAERSPRHLSIDLPAELSAEIHNVAARSGLLNEARIREIVREEARAAAIAATRGRVATIVAKHLEKALEEATEAETVAEALPQ